MYILPKKPNNGEAIQLFRKIGIHCAKHNIEMQAHWILTKPNSLADILLRGQYTKIADRYLFI